MDPQQCLFNLLTAIHDNDRDEVLGVIDDFSEWVRSGGALPEIWDLEKDHATIFRTK